MEGKIIIYLVFKELIISISGQTPTLEIFNTNTEVGSSFTLNCTVAITKAIAFKLNGVGKGSCNAPFLGELDPCDPVDITQNSTTNMTSWTISPAEPAHHGNWKCTLGTNTDSASIPLRIYMLPGSVLAEDGIKSNVIVNDTSSQSITVEVDCLFSENGPNVKLQFVKAAIPGATILMTCTNSSTACSTCTGCSAYDCNHNITLDQVLNSGKIEEKVAYTLQIEVGVLGTSDTYTSPLFTSFTVTFESQSTDSCDCNYWNCIGIILACVSISSLVCTVVLIWRRKQIELKAQNIIRCFEKLKWTCWGTSTPRVLHVAVLLILTIITLVIWFISMLIVICLCCAGKDCEVKGTVIGISFALSLVLILIFGVVFWITCCCADRGCRRVEVKCGNKKTLLDDFKKPDGEIEKVEWIHEGNIIVPSENTTGGTIATPPLTLQMVSLNQSGEYICIIKYASGGKKEEQVFRLKLIVLQQPPQQVNSCERVVLLNKLKSSTTIKSVVWTHDRKPVPTPNCIYEGGTTETPALTILDVSTDDSGMYECTLTCDQGHIRKYQVKLKVIEQLPQQVNSCERVVLLKKLKSSTTVTSVVWTHDRKPVPTTNCIYKGGTIKKPALTILDVSTDDSGMYECKLTLDQGHVRKYRSKLKVIEQPPQQVDSCERVVLLKKLKSSTTVTSVVWTHDRKPVPTTNCIYEGGTTEIPALTILVVSTDDSGMYECKLTLDQGHIRKYRFKLKVNGQPKQHVHSGELVVLLDKLASLNAVTSVVWTHDRKPVPQNNCMYEDGNTESPALTIPIVSPENSGMYECKLTLNQGLIRKYGVMLKVNVPKITKRVGERVMLLDKLKCPQQLNGVEWYINGSKVEAHRDRVKYQGGLKDSPSLLVGSLGREDSGRYMCDLLISESQIILHIPVDLEVEPAENIRTLPPIRTPHNRVHPDIQNQES